jgi:hypothetical protein
MRTTRIKVKNRKTGKTSIIKVPATLADDWKRSGGLPGFVGNFNNALKYLERQINSENGSIEDGYIIIKIGN